MGTNSKYHTCQSQSFVLPLHFPIIHSSLTTQVFLAYKQITFSYICTAKGIPRKTTFGVMGRKTTKQQVVFLTEDDYKFHSQQRRLELSCSSQNTNTDVVFLTEHDYKCRPYSGETT